MTFESAATARAYASDMELPWPLLIDSSREIYRAYAMQRGAWWNIYGPATLWMYLSLMIRGRKLKRSSGDPNQLGGDVLIDPEGVVRLHHVAAGPADRASVAQLLDVIRRHT